jgi:hypothetical protein
VTEREAEELERTIKERSCEKKNITGERASGWRGEK